MGKGLVKGQAVATPERREALLRHLRSVGDGPVCVTWPWSRRTTGYIHISDPEIYAHRWVWVQLNGPIPDGYEVCHNCPGGDNPSCIRPSHLWLGTHAQNIRDAYSKGRMTGNTTNHPRGEMHHSSRLSVDAVIDIRRRAKAGEVQRHLALEYEITPAALSAIVRRRSWAHVPED